MNAAEKNRIIKKALKDYYFDGIADISVIGGTGTAYGWVLVGIILPKVLEPQDEIGKRKSMREESETVLKVARKALAQVGEKLYTYCTDFGRDEECVLVNVTYE